MLYIAIVGGLEVNRWRQITGRDAPARGELRQLVRPRELAEELVAEARTRRTALTAEVAEAGFRARRDQPAAGATSRRARSPRH
jgi:hypothetical protein